MEQSKYNYVSALDEISPPPPTIEVSRNQPATVETNLGFVLTIANLLITGIIITAMMLDGTQVLAAIIAGSVYFAVTMIFFTLLVTGSLTMILADLSRERAEHHRIDAYENLGEQAIQWRISVERNRHLELTQQALPQQLTRRIAALETELLEQGTRRPPAHPPTYVTPYDNIGKAAFADEGPQVDSTAQEAVAWLSGLYNDLGQPDHKKVQLVGDAASLGRLRVRMLGSKRGQGSREAGLWLLNQGVVKKVAGGYQVQLHHFPSRESLRNLL